MRNRKEIELDILKVAYDSRGKIIQTVTEIERMIDYYIASKFLTDEDKIIELIITIISPLTLANKIEILSLLIEKYDKPFLDSHLGFMALLTRIREERNRFAHWPLEFSAPALSDFEQKSGITLVKLKAIKPSKLSANEDHLSVDRNLYTEDGITNLLVEIKKMDYAMRELVGWQISPPK